MNSKKISTLHFIQHVDFEGPGLISDWAKIHGVSVQIHRAWKGEFPTPLKGEGICLLGGPMNVDDIDEHPWLVQEKTWLKTLVVMDFPILGLCLGCQLLAEALGGRVFRNPVKEIGWMRVEWSETARRIFPIAKANVVAFQYHGDTFSLPSGSTRLASSFECINQGFLNGKNLGLQFHLEFNREECESLLENSWDDSLPEAKTIHSKEKIFADADTHSRGSRLAMDALLNAFFVKYL